VQARLEAERLEKMREILPESMKESQKATHLVERGKFVTTHEVQSDKLPVHRKQILRPKISKKHEVLPGEIKRVEDLEEGHETHQIPIYQTSRGP
jgi:hypothetical protein